MFEFGYDPGRIRRIRWALGLSQTDFGKLVGVTWRTISGWERGEFRPRTRLKDLQRVDELAAAINEKVAAERRVAEEAEEAMRYSRRGGQRTRSFVRQPRLATRVFSLKADAEAVGKAVREAFVAESYEALPVNLRERLAGRIADLLSSNPDFDRQGFLRAVYDKPNGW